MINNFIFIDVSSVLLFSGSSHCHRQRKYSFKISSPAMGSKSEFIIYDLDERIFFLKMC